MDCCVGIRTWSIQKETGLLRSVSMASVRAVRAVRMKTDEERHTWSDGYPIDRARCAICHENCREPIDNSTGKICEPVRIRTRKQEVSRWRTCGPTHPHGRDKSGPYNTRDKSLDGQWIDQRPLGGKE